MSSQENTTGVPSLYHMAVALNNHMTATTSAATTSTGSGSGGWALMGMTAGMFFFVLIVQLVIWIIAVVLLIKHGSVMHTWALVVGVVLLIFPIIPLSPLVVILLALFAKDSQKVKAKERKNDKGLPPMRSSTGSSPIR